MSSYLFILSFFVLLVLFVSNLHGSKLFHGKEHIDAKQNEITIDNVKEQWLDQYLDHFNLIDTRKWKQRYLINDQFYKAGGPFFLLVGGEYEISKSWMNAGNWIDNANRFGALCFQLEHRFYGKSRPTKDLSTENLRYFTIEQALADLADFIVAMNEAYNLHSSTKWIAFGGSYPGTLAARLRSKYPHLVHGVVSSSGVFSVGVDYSGYLQVVAESLRAHSDECVNAVKDGFSKTEVLLQQKEGQQILNKMFRLCDPIEESVKHKNDIATLYRILSIHFAVVAQYNKVHFSIDPSPFSSITIDTICDIMVNKNKGSSIHRLADVNNLMLNMYQSKCLNYKYDKMVEFWKNTSWMATGDCMECTNIDRPWLYQLCTEVGNFQTTSFPSHIFGNKCPIEYFFQKCEDVFGPKFNSTFIYDTVRRTGITYGGLNIRVTNTLLIQGSRDPWHLAGITQNTTRGPPVIYIEGTAHCADMVPESENDLPQLKAARKQIAEYINNWLQQE